LSWEEADKHGEAEYRWMVLRELRVWRMKDLVQMTPQFLVILLSSSPKR